MGNKCDNLQEEHSILEAGLISCKKFGNVTEEYCKECIDKENKCKHLRLYPDMRLQMKMAGCMHFLMHGFWECQDCNEWIFIELEDEWDGREGVKSKDGKHQYQVIAGKNKIVNIEVEAEITTGEYFRRNTETGEN